MCGGYPIVYVLVDGKAQHRGKWEQQQHRTSLDQLLVQHKCTVIGKKKIKTILSSHSPLFRDLPLYEFHQIRVSKCHRLTVVWRCKILLWFVHLSWKSYTFLPFVQVFAHFYTFNITFIVLFAHFLAQSCQWVVGELSVSLLFFRGGLVIRSGP